MSAAALIAEGAARLAVPLADEACEALATLTAELLRWNQRINLIGRCGLRDAVDRHVHDGLVLLRLLDRPELLDRATHWHDIGCGAGLPGLVLAAARPALRITLVEPNGKKIAFARHAIGLLGLGDRVRADQTRLEDLPAGSASAALSRATFAPAEWARRGRELVGPDGLVMVLMGAGAPSEVVEAAWLVDEVTLPLSGAQRITAVL